VNPGVARLAIVVALVVAGIAVLANGFGDEGTEAAPSPQDEPSPTRSPTPTPAPEEPDEEIVPQQEGVLVQVLNGTNRAGFAADFQATLEQQGGYLPAGEAADAPDKPIVDSVVYYRVDQQREQNRADAQLLSREYLGGVAVEALPRTLEDAVDPAADVVVVLGEDQAGAP